MSVDREKHVPGNNIETGEITLTETPRLQRGKVRWTLPGNSEEDNLQLGIRTVQALFLNRFPEFGEMFPRGEDGLVTDDKRVAADFIIGKIGTTEKTQRFLSSALLKTRHTPYFEGNLVTVIKKSFAAWGLTFESFDIRIEADTRIYTDKDGENWVIFSSIYESLGVSISSIHRRLANIRTIAGRDYENRETVFYNEKDLGATLSNFLALPRVDKESGVSIDKDGKRWTLGTDFARRFDIDRKTLLPYLEKVTTINGRNRAGCETLLYSEAELLELLKDNLTLPRADKINGVYTDDNGRKWIPIRVASLYFGLSHSTLINFLESVEFIIGKDRKGRQIKLYNEDELAAKLKDLLALPQVDKESGISVDKKGEEWAVAHYFTRRTGFDFNSPYHKYLKDGRIRTIEGRDKLGRKTTLYSITDGIEEIEQRRVGTNRLRSSEALSSEEANEDLERLFEIK